MTRWKIRAQRRPAELSKATRLFVAILQILVGDREHRIGLDLDIAHEALPGAGIADLGVIASGRDAGEAQPFVMVDFLVLVAEGQVGSPRVLSGRRKLKSGDGRAGEVPQANAFALRAELAWHGDRDNTNDNQRARHGEPPNIALIEE